MTATAIQFTGKSMSRGASEAGQFVAMKLISSKERLQSSFALSQNAEGTVNELNQVYQDCRKPNWDGYGANAISLDSYQLARRFLEALPLGMLTPSVGAEPDGHITLEWYRSPRRTLSISLSPQNELHYAALIGASKRFGTEPFNGEIANHILDLARSVMLP